MKFIVILIMIVIFSGSAFSQSDSTNMSSATNVTVENYYGYDQNGFFLHKDLAALLFPNSTPAVVTRITSGQQQAMTLEGDWWRFDTRKKLKSEEKYCFVIEEEWIPYVFVSEYDHEAKSKKDKYIKAGDVTPLNQYGGYDFKTSAREMK